MQDGKHAHPCQGQRETQSLRQEDENQPEIEVVSLDTDTSDDERTTVEWSSSSSSSSSSEDEVQVIGTRKVARIIDSTRVSGPSYSRFTSRRIETKNSSDHFTRNFNKGFSGGNHDDAKSQVAGRSRQLGVYTGNVTQNSSGGRDVTNKPRQLGSFTRNFNKGFSGRNYDDAKARSQAISKWIENLHN